jgi:single-stranded-DNA-specific exonuclease
MSVLGKKWKILEQDADLSVFEKLLKNRNHKPDEQLKDFHDPFLFSDMEKAVARIKEAIKNEERIIIFGDYDVDGITSTAILFHTLKLFGAQVSYRLPNRVNDGYGLSDKFVDEAAEKGVKLFITVDNGISSRGPVQRAADQGVDVIITDHHRVPEQIPDAAHAIIHPLYDDNYPYSGLTGAGVALKLAQALIERLWQENESISKESFLDQLLDLSAMGTVADLGPLTGENRLIVKRGLKQLKDTSWAGLKKLKESSGIRPDDEVCASKIGFRLAPRINAAGRIGDPYLPLSLLLQQEGSPKLNELCQELEDLNQLRRDMTEQIMEEVEQKLQDLTATAQETLPKILIFHSPDWHVGILGLVAGRIAEKFARPTILLKERENDFVASARSPEFFNIIEALSANAQLLDKFGGHAQAAGFNVKKEQLQDLKKALNETAEEQLIDKELKSSLTIDCELNLNEISLGLLQESQKLAPFGIANAKPLFLLKQAQASFVETVGAESRHLKFSIQTPISQIKTIAFNLGDHAPKLRESPQVDIVFHIENNRWRNRDNLQLLIVDFKFHSA